MGRGCNIHSDLKGGISPAGSSFASVRGLTRLPRGFAFGSAGDTTSPWWLARESTGSAGDYGLGGRVFTCHAYGDARQPTRCQSCRHQHARFAISDVSVVNAWAVVRRCWRTLSFVSSSSMCYRGATRMTADHLMCRVVHTLPAAAFAVPLRDVPSFMPLACVLFLEDREPGGSMVEGVHGYLYALAQNRADHRCHRRVQPLPSGISTRAPGGRDLHGYRRRRDSTPVPQLRAASSCGPESKRTTSAVT